ncbi:MAG: hypothetical protein N3F10_05155 [Candidatus Bathyarchaeota archaeon]|nr:hypothetical protein [Candidatus Bathyarchaeota archaeon]MCX8177668.1 hypothetical protein [Candidatus Bathyarchaeota archaeon]MDW8193923.1 hypothetical protein [Nitrososphaerota archaeon]
MRTRDLALTAVFAALQAILATLPFTLTIGVSGQITLGVIGGPMIGILLGPINGGLATLIGALVGVFINPAGAIFGVLTVIPPFFGAVSAGCVRVKRGYVAGLLMLAALLIFYAHPYGREAYFYPWLHIIAIIVAFSHIAKSAGAMFDSQKFYRLLFSVAIAVFIGVLADHVVGSALGIWYFSPILTPEIWYAIMLVYPLERAVAVALASTITASVYYSLKRAGILSRLE